MIERLNTLIENHRALCKQALWRGEKELALLYVSIICGFKILVRMIHAPERCLYSPPSFSGNA